MTVTGFEFATAGRILAGPGRVAELPGVLAGLGSRVLVCTGANPERHASLLAAWGFRPRCFRWRASRRPGWPGPGPPPRASTAPT